MADLNVGDRVEVLSVPSFIDRALQANDDPGYRRNFLNAVLGAHGTITNNCVHHVLTSERMYDVQLDAVPAPSEIYKIVAKAPVPFFRHNLRKLQAPEQTVDKLETTESLA